MKKWIIYISVILVMIDLLSKLLIVNSFEVGESLTVIKKFFSITFVKNTGAAWGMFSSGTIVLAMVSMVFLYFFIKYIVELKSISLFNVINYSLIISGIIGNMVDRLVRGYVVDFLNFYIFSYDFPVFNIADIFIVVGIILVMLDTILVGDKSDSK